MSDRSFDIAMYLAIPVGHRVAVVIYERPKRSAWDGSVKDWKSGEVPEHEMVVRDLDSGIVYGMEWHFRLAPGEVPGTEPLADLVVAERVEGEVRACRTMIIGSEGHHSTRLVVGR